MLSMSSSSYVIVSFLSATNNIAAWCGVFMPVRVPWIFPGAPLKVNGAPWNIQGNFTAMCLVSSKSTWHPYFWHRLTLIPAWISNYIHNKVWDKITYPFPNFDFSTIEVWEWISYFYSTLYWACDYLYMLRLKLIHVSERGHWSSTSYLRSAVHHIIWTVCGTINFF